MNNPSESTPAPGIGNSSRVRRYRVRRRCSDYVPLAEGPPIVEVRLDWKLDKCAAGVINQLVSAGHRAISGNDGRR
jgi:hypothetical protein